MSKERSRRGPLTLLFFAALIIIPLAMLLLVFRHEIAERARGSFNDMMGEASRDSAVGGTESTGPRKGSNALED